MAASAAESMVARSLRDTLARVARAAERANRSHKEITVVAVGKTKPVSMIQEAYDAGHRDFGENYVQEIVEKAPLLPRDIRWHFIGHLQSNKAKGLIAEVPNLHTVETVDSVKIANHLNRACSSAARQERLRVMVQVNTSGEPSKYGVEPSECVGLVKHVVEECPYLRFAGLMTIGMLDYSSRPENFHCLQECRRHVCQELGLGKEHCGLSMGMSGDFEQAVEMGSTNVRIGSTIFGARDYSKTVAS
ncbi:hypothetical protein CBR_g51397 [Chara braunii]|uniref:Pyridoxal phosphate homeostasis protein n=1 Tax=Chara braunii TaxID=69332 RepID=A0A388M8K7_CHABU|nr:hypothetical protein CBR_g51397 [Chara braunii]|eukprot:GBG90890.1 hypothetical protein CBR_g51397 [Chara braunii]